MTGPAADPAALTSLVAIAREAARASGLDLRDVAAALYVDGDETPVRDEQVERQRLRSQIAALEQTLSDLVSRRPGQAHPPDGAPLRPQHARVLDAAGLAEQRDALVRRLAEAQGG